MTGHWCGFGGTHAACAEEGKDQAEDEQCEGEPEGAGGTEKLAAEEVVPEPRQECGALAEPRV